MRGVSYLITYRESGSPDRRENLLTVLRWLAQWPDVQTIVIEQDTVARLEPGLPSAGDPLLAYNPGPFNKGWGLNVAARLSRNPLLAIGDADVLAPHTLAEAVERCRQGQHSAVKPYRRVADLTPEESERVRGGNWGSMPARARDAARHRGPFAGGLFVIQRDAYWRLGGFDERFRGWGCEDSAMTVKLRRAQVPSAMIDAQPALHLWHPRSQETTFGQPYHHANMQLLADYRAYTDAEFATVCEVQRQMMGNLHKYRPPC